MEYISDVVFHFPIWFFYILTCFDVASICLCMCISSLMLLLWFGPYTHILSFVLCVVRDLHICVLLRNCNV